MIRQRGITLIELILACASLAIVVSAVVFVARAYGALGIVSLAAGASILIALYARSRPGDWLLLSSIVDCPSFPCWWSAPTSSDRRCFSCDWLPWQRSWSWATFSSRAFTPGFYPVEGLTVC